MNDQLLNINILKKELTIPEKYLLCIEDKIYGTIHKQWLSSILHLNPVEFITHDRFNPDEIAAQPSLDELGTEWLRIYIKVM
jgi:hypothetical protein